MGEKSQKALPVLVAGGVKLIQPSLNVRDRDRHIRGNTEILERIPLRGSAPDGGSLGELYLSRVTSKSIGFVAASINPRKLGRTAIIHLASYTPHLNLL